MIYMFLSNNPFFGGYKLVEEPLVIRHIFSLVDTIAKAKFSNSSNDFKICLFG